MTTYLVEMRGYHPGRKLDVSIQVKLGRDMIAVPLNFRLTREVLTPIPFVE
tara:strand:- start:392 stop:544 length:153 start_codon:yes stop_codon:yes gene_type:complete